MSLDDGVPVPVEDQHRSLISGGRTVDIQSLGGQEVFPAQFHHAPATDKRRGIRRVEARIEEFSVPAGILDDGSGSEQHECIRSLPLPGESACRHRSNDSPLGMTEDPHLCHIGERPDILPDGLCVGEFFPDCHILHLPLTLAVAVEVKADGCDPRRCQAFCELRHRAVILAGENPVHQNDHRAVVLRRVEAIWQADLAGESALGPLHRIILGEGEKKRKDHQEHSCYRSFHKVLLI